MCQCVEQSHVLTFLNTIDNIFSGMSHRPRTRPLSSSSPKGGAPPSSSSPSSSAVVVSATALTSLRHAACLRTACLEAALQSLGAGWGSSLYVSAVAVAGIGGT